MQIWNTSLSQCCCHSSDVPSSPFPVMTYYFLNIEIFICLYFCVIFLFVFKSRDVICNFYNVINRNVRIYIQSKGFLRVFLEHLNWLIIDKFLKLFLRILRFFCKFWIQFHDLLFSLLVKYKIFFNWSFWRSE